jgi:hypothetical protein
MFNGARTTEAHVKASDPARITARFKEWRDAFARDVYGQDEVDL